MGGESMHVSRRPRGALTIDLRSTGLLCLLLWGLALPRSIEAAGKPVATVESARHPVLRLNTMVDPTALEGEVGDLLERKLEARERILRRLGPHGVSEKGLALRQRRLGEIQAKGFKAAAADGPDTLRVLVIRIDFENDRAPLLSTGDGRFECGEADSSQIFDPPPHDSAYFAAHLEGLSRYWSSMSAGRLHVEARILPEGDCEGYSLGDMADYGPGNGGFWSIDGLVRLVRDMITTADMESPVPLADYDFDDPNTYVIFAHSGSDLQSNLVFEPGQPGYTPNDIPTFFVQLGDEDEVALSSIDTDTGEPGLMRECSVIPETTTQDGLLGSIAAALYHEFGHALGLPDLYSTQTGLPTLGYWDLMDSGTNLAAFVQVDENDDEGLAVTGLLPPSISIWCKWFLGWVDPIRIGTDRKKVFLPGSYRQDVDDKAILLDVSPDEFFLVENRYIAPFVPANGQGGPAWALIRDQQSGVVLYLGENVDGLDRPRNTHMYDFFMPWPGGTLLWRVQQAKIDQRIASNLVQGFPGDFPLELIEADGIQDIGIFDFRTIGFVGSETDAFRAQEVFERGDGIDPVVYEATQNRVTGGTRPNTLSSVGARTGAILTTILPWDSINLGVFMLAEVQASTVPDDPEAGRAPAYPVWLPAVVDDDGFDVVARGQADAVAYQDVGGEPTILAAVQASNGLGGTGVYGFDLDGNPRFGTDGLGFALSAPVAGALAAVSDFNGRAGFVAVARDGSVHARSTTLQAGVPASLPGFPASFGGPVDTGPLVMQTGSSVILVAGDRAGHALRIVDASGLSHPDWSSSFPISANEPLRGAPSAADVNGDGTTEAIVFASGSFVRAWSVGSAASEFFSVSLRDAGPLAEDAAITLISWPSAEAGEPDRILALLEQDGVGRMWRIERDGGRDWSSERFGELMPYPTTGEPAIGDLDGDGSSDLVVLDERWVWAYNEQGFALTGFPILLSDQFFPAGRDPAEDGPSSTPLIADVDGDGANELVLVSQLGLLYALEKDGAHAQRFPRKVVGPTATAPLMMDYVAGGSARRALLFFEALGDTVVGGAATRAPRLSKVELPEPAIPGNRPSEWLGRGGGVERTARARSGGAVVQQGPTEFELEPRVYPNPAAGNLARVRFYSGADQTARLTVYSLEGEPLLEAEQHVAANMSGEVEWGIGRLVSGPYLCKLDYIGPTGPDSKILTLYIER